MTVKQISARLSNGLEDLDSAQELYIVFSYSVHDPLAVVLHFMDDGEGEIPVWEVSRDLLTEGLYSKSGEGDIVSWPSSEGDEYYIFLRSPHGSCLLTLSHHEVMGFLRETWSEHDGDISADLEEEIQYIFEEG